MNGFEPVRDPNITTPRTFSSLHYLLHGPDIIVLTFLTDVDTEIIFYFEKIWY